MTQENNIAALVADGSIKTADDMLGKGLLAVDARKTMRDYVVNTGKQIKAGVQDPEYIFYVSGGSSEAMRYLQYLRTTLSRARAAHKRLKPNETLQPFNTLTKLVTANDPITGVTKVIIVRSQNTRLTEQLSEFDSEMAAALAVNS